MDNGDLPGGDDGIADWVEFPNEMYAQLFAFMSLIHPDQATRDDYAQRARTLLMHVMNLAVNGEASGQPFRDIEFSTGNRSRWWGEGFPLTVDWIYPYLSTADKATIRTVFLRWIDENLNASTTDYNHPEPIGTVNDPILLSDERAVRWSCNNYYLAHMRNIGLMAMSMDAADDAGEQLRSYLDNATGAWLYVIDHLLRNDGRGGFSPEGLEYGPEAFGYYAQFMLALHTAGEDDPAKRGQQVSIPTNPFLGTMGSAYIYSLSPATAILQSRPWIGPVYQPAWYGDGQNYFMPDFIAVFGALAVYDYNMGNTPRLEALRWVERNTPPGGSGEFLTRIRQAEIFRDAILLFLMFDPAAQEAIDPRVTMPREFYATGLGRILARTDWSKQASMFTYSLGWITIDHQHGDGNQIEYYRDGEWLTKDRTGWDGTNILCSVGRSDYHNTMALENEPSNLDPDHFLNLCHANGSQWMYVPNGDGKILATSLQDDYVFACGDATELYNSSEAESMDIAHASRSVLWLKPDHIFLYDRAESKTDGRFKRFWMNFPAAATVNGNVTSMTSPKGQQLFVSTLLPLNASISTAPAEAFDEDVANDEPMNHRLLVEATGGPKSTRFLNVVQGADAGTRVQQATLVESTSGTAFSGAAVADACVLFPVDLKAAFSPITYTVPTSVVKHYVTGLIPDAQYNIAETVNGSSRTVTISTGIFFSADQGGVLHFTTGTVGIENAQDRPYAFRLGASYPNPVIAGAAGSEEFLSIPFELASSGHVVIDVYDQNGRMITRLTDQEFIRGSHVVRLPLGAFGPGMYFYQLRSGAEHASGYFTLLR
ncbi:MAG: T9SS type A sorting domain-containing protein [Bacteroidetes bacterium]|nr:T9SS type A sorting domain-containing protein [Bacteroidota bacterium]